MFKVTPENIRVYLRKKGLVSEDAAPAVQPLGWGISNTVIRVEGAKDCFIIKQPLPKLRVKDDWPFDQSRVFVERDCMALLQDILPPGSTPRVRFSDEENFIFGMSCAPSGGRLWKEELLAGKIVLETARQAGELLSLLHGRSAEREAVKSRFADQTVFLQGRVDPYHWTAAKAHPGLSPLIHSETQRMLQTRLCLVHGDYSPKNIFAYSDRILILDFEVAHYGDPAFDTGFFLTHLVLKAVKFPRRGQRYLEAARHFWEAYRRPLSPEEKARREATTIRELGCILLARIDGKSKVEYLTEEADKNRVRELAGGIIKGSETELNPLLEAMEEFIKKG